MWCNAISKCGAMHQNHRSLCHCLFSFHRLIHLVIVHYSLLVTMTMKQKARREFNRGGQSRTCKEARVVENMEKKRTHYTILQKITLCEYAEVHMEVELSAMSDIVDEVGVPVSCISRWLDQLPILRHINRNDQVRLSVNPGCCGQLEDVGAELLAFVEELRNSGYAVSRKMIVAKACQLLGTDSDFSSKSFAARAQSVSHWMARNDLLICTGTHQAQAPPQRVLTAAEDFIVNIARPAVNQSYHDRRYIINMDQTPVFFSMHLLRSVDKIGTCTVNIRIAKNGRED
jgi:hypothetical protein